MGKLRQSFKLKNKQERKKQVGGDFYQYVYVDDDRVHRDWWEILARGKGINLLLLELIKRFDDYREMISKENTKIYLDCNLGDGEMRGDEFAKILHKRDIKIFI